ncbi:hypothetical protein, partial [Streptomyces sp.]|uniref:hypothetical protein n=1 Tax=Streptomyces sp. TaxID=1931 RepID=UPI002F402D35
GGRGAADGAGRLGSALAENVLGAGMLVVPPIAAGLAGAFAPAAWAVHLLLGAVFSAALGALALARPAAPASIAGLTGAVLGRRAGTALVAVYLCGFVVGQAALATVAGRLAALVWDATRPAVTLASAALVLAAATAGCLGGVTLGPGARRLRSLVTLALAGYCCARPGLFRAAGLVPDTHWPAAAVFLLLFAGVGWEGSARLAARAGTRRRLMASVGLGASGVAVVFLGLALLLGDPGSHGPAALNGLDHAAAGCAALLLACYCLTNVAAAAQFARTLGVAGDRTATASVGAWCLAVTLGGAALGLGPAGLLAGPASATLTGYLLACAACLRGGATTARLLSALAAAGLLAVGVLLAAGPGAG